MDIYQYNKWIKYTIKLTNHFSRNCEYRRNERSKNLTLADNNLWYLFFWSHFHSDQKLNHLQSPLAVHAFFSIPLSYALCSVTHVTSHLYSVIVFDKWNILPSLTDGCKIFASKLNESIRRVLNHILIHVERAAEAHQWKQLEVERGRSYRL